MNSSFIAMLVDLIWLTLILINCFSNPNWHELHHSGSCIIFPRHHLCDKILPHSVSLWGAISVNPLALVPWENSSPWLFISVISLICLPTAFFTWLQNLNGFQTQPASFSRRKEVGGSRVGSGTLLWKTAERNEGEEATTACKHLQLFFKLDSIFTSKQKQKYPNWRAFFLHVFILTSCSLILLLCRRKLWDKVSAEHQQETSISFDWNSGIDNLLAYLKYDKHTVRPRNVWDFFPALFWNTGLLTKWIRGINPEDLEYVPSNNSSIHLSKSLNPPVMVYRGFEYKMDHKTICYFEIKAAVNPAVLMRRIPQGCVFGPSLF